MNFKLFSTALLFLPLLFSCDSKKDLIRDTTLSHLESKAQPQQDNRNEKKQKIPGSSSTPDQVDSITTSSPLQPTAHVDWDKKIIKTATVRLEVKDFKKYNEAVHKTISQFGGYIAQEEQNRTDEKSETVFSIKVPVAQFEPIMNELGTGDVKVLERKITSEDVTGEVIDTRSRLEAKKQVRLKYLDFLKESKNMAEVLQVQGEINNIQEDIEAATGRVEYLSHQSAFSTIHLTFYQPGNGFRPVDTSPSFLNRVSNAFKTGAEWMADFFIGLVSVWPILLLIIGGVFVFKGTKSLKRNAQNA